MPLPECTFTDEQLLDILSRDFVLDSPKSRCLNKCAALFALAKGGRVALAHVPGVSLNRDYIMELGPFDNRAWLFPLVLHEETRQDVAATVCLQMQDVFEADPTPYRGYADQFVGCVVRQRGVGPDRHPHTVLHTSATSLVVGGPFVAPGVSPIVRFYEMPLYEWAEPGPNKPWHNLKMRVVDYPTDDVVRAWLDTMNEEVAPCPG